MIFLFALSSLATFCCALFVAKTTGPAKVFKKARNLPPRSSSFWEGIRCPWCVATWFAFIWTGYLWSWSEVPLWLTPLWWFASTGAAIVLNQAFTKE